MKKIKVEKPKKEKKALLLRIDDELYSHLLKTSKQNKVTLTFLINELLRWAVK